MMPSAWNIDIAGQMGAAGGPPGPSGPGYLASSTTNLPIATGPITVTTQAGLAYLPGARARLSSNGDPTQWMEGRVTAYSGTSLSLNVDLTNATAAATQVPPVLPNYLGGLTLSNDVTTPATVLDIAMGGATSDDSSTLMTLPVTGFTKNCNAAWAVGSGNGALDVGSALAVNTWYHVYLIKRTDTLVVDVLISTSATAPTLPTNYTKKRRIGTIPTNASSQLQQFKQVGDEFLYTTIPTGWDLANVGIAAGAGTLIAVNVPQGVQVIAIVNAVSNLAAQYGVIKSPDELASLGAWNFGFSTGGGGAGYQYRVRTNTAQQIRVIGGAAYAGGFYFSAVGWVDNRGK